MLDYLYDGTFQGLLTCIYNHYYVDRASCICCRDQYQPSMLNSFMEVETDAEKADRVYNAIENKISGYSLRCVYRAFLSCDQEKENKILRYVVLGFRTGPRLGSLHGNSVVHDMDAMVKKVGVEKERMLEFVRFQVMDVGDGAGGQVMYAEVEPDNDVLELIGNHFADRFKNDPFIIRDARRDKAIIASGGNWYISEFPKDELLPGGSLRISEEEADYTKLWQTYFRHIAIMERKNSRCQRNFMPARYWKHLTEMQDIDI